MISRQLGHSGRFETRLAGAIEARLEGALAAPVLAGLLASTAMIAGRIGLRHWNTDYQKRGARFHVENAFAQLQQALAPGGCASGHEEAPLAR